ncbi:MAG: recombination protein RecR [Candidatus Zambryskibacteria bacterium]|nr:recombination protein RecR [Candidatus Zambryskibacteria bacterium]
MNSIDKLIEIFSKFPGIGPRQARRFVYHLLTRANGALEELAYHIKNLKVDIAVCDDCQRFFQLHHTSKQEGSPHVCDVCSNKTRDHTILMIVQRDIDLESVEKNDEFNGIYFVLGGSVPILEKEPEKRIRIKKLKEFINLRQAQDKEQKIKEIILGVNWNPEGENTGDYVAKELKSITDKYKIKITHLGKGLSMGAELEYTDSDTLKNALKNRS